MLLYAIKTREKIRNPKPGVLNFKKWENGGLDVSGAYKTDAE